MFSNDKHPSSDWRPSGYQPKPFLQENLLYGNQIVIERKELTITLRENPKGRFIRIVERGGNHQASIIIPSTGFKDFQKVLADMVKAEKEIPTKANPN